MGDLTSILKTAQNSEYDYVNLFVVLFGTLASAGGFILYGIQGTVGSGNQFDVIILGVAFFLLTLFGWLMIYIIGGSLTKSEASWPQSAFATVLPMVVLNFGTLVSNIQLSAFRLPSRMYASAAMTGEPASVRDIVNLILAPGGENIALLGLGSVISVVVYEKTGNAPLAMVAGAFPAGVFFSYIHGLTSLGFKAVAFSIMFVSALYLYGADLGVYLPLKRYIPITFGFFYGVHRSINTSNAGGLVEFYTTILSAPEPLLYVGQAIVILDSIMYLLAGYYVAVKLFQGLTIGAKITDEVVG
ncbi:hypothetical protein [Haloplanus natans]|uniref:hypothetical protein n=1 Tax=Haloplanus natans TaxID=376171 RepID=UPI0006782AAD|nr:hypothetical protein [Haloplanus natans]